VTASRVDSTTRGEHRAARGALAVWPARPGPRPIPHVVAAVAAWAAAASVTLAVPDQPPSIFIVYEGTAQLGMAAATVAAIIAVVGVFGAWIPGVGARLARFAPWLTVLGLAAGAYELATAKLAWLPRPYFTSPQEVAVVFRDDAALLLESLLYSLRLLAIGFAVGAGVGFLTGVAMGWSRRVNYWLYPVARTIGPVPAAAWLPIAYVVLPTNTIASLFMIALAAWFPMALLTWSGVAGVSRSYYDVARTLGASERFLVWKVAVPAALPSVFVGLFMGLGGSFISLVVAEELGVKAGLGWYIQWALGWGEWKKAWAGLLIMVVLFSGLITLLFRLRNRVLSWQQGLVRW